MTKQFKTRRRFSFYASQRLRVIMGTGSQGSQDFEIKLENKLIEPGDFVAILRDVITVYDDGEEASVFRGQVGRVSTKLSEHDYLIYFFDELASTGNPEREFLFKQLVVLRKDLVKLHFVNPEFDQFAKYSSQLIDLIESESDNTLNELQNDLDLDDQFSERLIEHEMMPVRFNPGNLVTILFDFATSQDNKNIVIYSGQVAMIKEFFPETKYVSVVFRSCLLNDLVFKDYNLRELENISKLKKEGEWVVEAQIHKNFLFSLYYQELKLTEKGKQQILEEKEK